MLSYEAALVTLLAAAPFALATAYYDLRDMEIPHWLAISSTGAFIALVFATLPVDDALWRLGIAAAVLVAGFGLFTIGALAGGDAKALATFAILVAPQDASVVLILLSVFGILTAVGVTLLRRTALAGGQWKVWSADRRYPYGVALCAALLVYLGLVVLVAAG